MRAILFFLLALFSSRDSRIVIVYDTPTPVYGSNSPEFVMAQPKGEETFYRFSASIETRPGEGCEADTVLYFVRDYMGAGGMPGVQRQEITIHRSTVTGVAEIPTSTFRVKAGSRVGFHVEYLIGGHCKTRPTYQVFPFLEQM